MSPGMATAVWTWAFGGITRGADLGGQLKPATERQGKTGHHKRTTGWPISVLP